jgi:hypothetical protein
MKSYILRCCGMILLKMLLLLSRYNPPDGTDKQNKAKLKTFVNKKRKLVNMSNQLEYTRKRQRTSDDPNGTECFCLLTIRHSSKN